jgi:hypothetical protein
LHGSEANFLPLFDSVCPELIMQEFDKILMSPLPWYLWSTCSDEQKSGNKNQGTKIREQKSGNKNQGTKIANGGRTEQILRRHLYVE